MKTSWTPRLICWERLVWERLLALQHQQAHQSSSLDYANGSTLRFIAYFPGRFLDRSKVPKEGIPQSLEEIISFGATLSHYGLRNAALKLNGLRARWPLVQSEGPCRRSGCSAPLALALTNPPGQS
uniref:Uncharacterized protein n=1 Tax=Knipowitschia caucasica TaxID=637954 RepID=A0AAV2MHJ8_KNICA